jgi:hypothetical protein
VRPPIVTVPVRAPPVLAAAVIVAVPLPLPDAPLAIVRNESLLTAVHAHDELVLETVAVTLPPLAGAVALTDDRVIAHVAGAFGDSCVKLTTAPPTAIDPLRDAP